MFGDGHFWAQRRLYAGHHMTAPRATRWPLATRVPGPRTRDADSGVPLHVRPSPHPDLQDLPGPWARRGRGEPECARSAACKTANPKSQMIVTKVRATNVGNTVGKISRQISDRRRATCTQYMHCTLVSTAVHVSEYWNHTLKLYNPHVPNVRCTVRLRCIVEDVILNRR